LDDRRDVKKYELPFASAPASARGCLTGHRHPIVGREVPEARQNARASTSGPRQRQTGSVRDSDRVASDLVLEHELCLRRRSCRCDVGCSGRQAEALEDGVDDLGVGQERDDRAPGAARALQHVDIEGACLILHLSQAYRR